MLRTVVWIVLIVTGVLAVLLTLLFTTSTLAVAVGIVVVGCWVVWGYFTSYWYGIARHVSRHLGPRWVKGEVVRHRVKTGERVNLQIALNILRLADDEEGSVFGVPGSYTDHLEGEHLIRNQMVGLISSNPEPVPLAWESLPQGPDRTLDCANNALYLLRCAGKPACVLVEGRSKGGRKPAVVQVLAQNKELAQATLDELLKVARENSAYKGSVISIHQHHRQVEDFSVEFHRLEPVEREAIILPDNLLEVVERNVLGALDYAKALRQAKQATRHGLLLHGPPGTGKTLVTRYLAQTAAPATVLLLTGRQYVYLRPTMQLARLLAPSLVILEDVDLIATERRKNRHTPLLHELMDEMDGLSSATDCIFLMTTNRPEALEPALSARPGRVDQAIYFPLPNAECRHRLFGRFTEQLSLEEVDLDPLVQRTEGASPAFIKELVRRSTIMAIHRGVRTQPITLSQDDIEGALRELVEFGGALTRQFLGFPGAQDLGGVSPRS